MLKFCKTITHLNPVLVYKTNSHNQISPNPMDLIHWVFLFSPYKFSLIQSTGLIPWTAFGILSNLTAPGKMGVSRS